MPITINGSGTITGLSVGGLPDGIVDTDMLANNAVTSAKSTIAEGKVLQFKPFNTFTADSFSSGTNNTGLGGSITPTSASNKIFILANQWAWSDTGPSESKFGGAFYFQRSTDATAIDNGNWSNLSDSSDKNWGFNFENTNNSGSGEMFIPFMHYDHPNSTSAVWYRVRAQRFTANTSYVKPQEDSRGSFMYLMEIKA